MSAYTKHYQLHQWDPQDPFLRTDFNQDLSKIDTALGAIPYVKIKDLVIDSPQSQVDLDVSDIDFTQYLKIELFIQCPECDGSITVQVNHLDEGYYSGATSGSTSGFTSKAGFLASFYQYGYGVLLFYTPHLKGKVSCVNIAFNGTNTYSGYQYSAPCTWSELESFNFLAYGGSFAKGSRFCLCGVKA